MQPIMKKRLAEDSLGEEGNKRLHAEDDRVKYEDFDIEVKMVRFGFS